MESGSGSEQPAGRLPDGEVLGIIAATLTELTGRPWEVVGERVQSPGSVVVVLGQAEHSDEPGHLHPTFVLNPEHAADTSLPDCVAGYGATPREKVEQAVHTWATTTGIAVLELLAQNGQIGHHFPAGDPDGFPGWHAIQGGINGWGVGAEHDVVQAWAAETPLLPIIAPALAATGFERDQLIGVKAFFGSYRGTDTAEVRVNGEVDEAASEALRTAAWPRPADGGAFARTYVILVHRES